MATAEDRVRELVGIIQQLRGQLADKDKELKQALAYRDSH